MKRAPKFSERDLDDDFEQFLKESLSDDSVNSDKLNKYFAKSRREEEGKKNDSQPWWMKEKNEDEEDEVAMVSRKDEKTPTANKWLKPKKESTPIADKEETMGRYQKDSSKKALGEASDAGMKKSNFSKDSLEDLTATGKSDAKFNDPKERSGVLPSQPSFEDTLSYTETGTSDGLTPASTGPGIETLEEQADKERFFQELEAKRGGLVDYRRLIKDADMSNTLGSLQSGNMSMTMGTMPSAYMGTADEHSSPLLRREPPGKRGALNADDDDASSVTPDTSPSQPTVHPPTRPMASPKKGMLAKVALLDTGDSMLNTGGQAGETAVRGGGGDMTSTATTRKPTLDSSGFLGAGTATEIEALQAVLREAANTPTMDFSSTGITTGEATQDDMRPRTVDDIIREVQEEKDRMWRNNANMQSRLSDSRDSDNGFEVSRPELTNRKQRYQREDETESHGNRKSELHPISESRGFDLQPADESRGFDLQPADESRGFDLQPAIESTGFDLQPANESRGFDLQPVNESTGFDLKPANESRGFALQPANESRGIDEQPMASLGVHRVDSHGISADDENSLKRNLVKQSKRGIPKRTGGKATSSRYSNIKGSGYGNPKTAAVWSPAETAKKKVKGLEVPSLHSEPGKTRGNIMASVESFANYIQEHFAEVGMSSVPQERPIQPRPSRDSSLPATAQETRLELISRERALVSEVAQWQAQWKEAHKLNAKLRAEMTGQQREAARREEELALNHQREVFKLKQDNVVLQAKLNVQDEQQGGRKQTLSGRALEGASQEEIKLMQKEIIEQETLLQGYQQENERLYNEVRRLQKSNSDGEDKLLRENQKLQTELANAKEALEQKDVALRHKGLITGAKVQQEIAAGNNPAVLGAGRIAELQSELREAQLREAALQQRLRQADDASQELQQHIATLAREKGHALQKLQDLRDVKQREFQDMQQQYQREIETLNKKLRWYAENQDMLDKDVHAMRDKNEEIKRLKEILEKVNTQTNQKTTEAQKRARERGADAKRIQDLERQVREMNDIIRKRHPNSLPALIYAAAASDRAHDGSKDPAHPAAKSHTAAFLEEKVKKMEAELDEKEAETKMFARVLEQKYNVMKFQYEDRLQALEKQLNRANKDAKVTKSLPRPSATPAGEGPDGNVADLYRMRMEELRAENEDLRGRLGRTATKVAWEDGGIPTEGDRGTGLDREGQEERLTSLARELSNKDHEIELLKATCEKLMQERFLALQAGESSQVKGESSSVKAKSLLVKKPRRSKTSAGSTTGSKQYQPENFSGTHVSDVLSENEQLKQQLDQFSLEMEQQRVSAEALLAKSEGAIRRIREDTAEQLATLRATHAAETDRLAATRALDHSDSRHAKLVNQLDAQKVMIKHLQEQLLEARVDMDTLSAARVREQLLQTQIEQMSVDLREAKQTHSPEMRHFEALQAKIVTMEARHSQREQELQQLVARARHSASHEKDQELAGYRETLANKNRELQQFRSELDAILEVLRELQRQGIVLPLHGHTVQSLLQ